MSFLSSDAVNEVISCVSLCILPRWTWRDAEPHRNHPDQPIHWERYSTAHPLPRVLVSLHHLPSLRQGQTAVSHYTQSHSQRASILIPISLNQEHKWTNNFCSHAHKHVEAAMIVSYSDYISTSTPGWDLWPFLKPRLQLNMSLPWLRALHNGTEWLWWSGGC